jgi:hypothetical protein
MKVQTSRRSTQLKSKIVSDLELETELLRVCEFSSSTSDKWQLLYRASDHGYEARDFHAKCDDKINTLTIIKTTDGYIFGGFTVRTWESEEEYKLDWQAFIFSLRNGFNKPIKLKIHKPFEKAAIVCSSLFGPAFGSDIFISNNSKSEESNCLNFGDSYPHPRFECGSHEASSFLAGSPYFLVDDIEVYQKL